MRHALLLLMPLAMGFLPLAAAAAPAAASQPQPAASREAVYTRGEFRGRSRQGGRDYVHIKVAVGRQVPFSTLSFQQGDAVLPAGIADGTVVEFRAHRVGGENVLVEIRRAQGR